MVENNADRQKPAGRFTWLWMVLSLVLVAGFLVWLGVKSEPTQIQVVEEEEEAAADTLVAMDVPRDSFVVNLERYTGEDIRLREIPVASLLGPEMFWTELPSDQAGLNVPYLIALNDTIAADTTREPPRSGDTVTVVGQVFPVTDSVLDQWIADGVLDENGRAEAEFASTFLEVKWIGVRPGRRSQGGGGSSSE